MLRSLREFRIMTLACLIYILGFQTSTGYAGLNLCIGAGGHVEIEAKDAGCCPSQEASHSELALAQEEGACASCIDVSLGDNAAHTLATSASHAIEVFLPAPSVLERLSPFQATAATPDRGDPMEPTLRAIRTVVLRV